MLCSQRTRSLPVTLMFPRQASAKTPHPERSAVNSAPGSPKLSAISTPLYVPTRASGACSQGWRAVCDIVQYLIIANVAGCMPFCASAALFRLQGYTAEVEKHSVSTARLLDWRHARSASGKEQKKRREPLATDWPLQQPCVRPARRNCCRAGDRPPAGPLAQNLLDHPGWAFCGLHCRLCRTNPRDYPVQQGIMNTPFEGPAPEQENPEQTPADPAMEERLSGAYNR